MTGTVVVTGGGSGIGRAICQELATLGWRVIVTDLSADAANETVSHLDGGAERGHEAHPLNVTNAADAATMANDIQQRYGLDAWVSNAGVSKMKRFIDITKLTTRSPSM
jgi:meso-butanediol dehydrogenase / (S,S)-butanediol dehydrogenase / diacetyl reductase